MADADELLHSYARAKVMALRVKLCLVSAALVIIPAFLLFLMWSDEIGRKIAREAGWEVQALFVFVLLVGLAMLGYAFVFIRMPPDTETEPGREAGETEGSANG